MKVCENCGVEIDTRDGDNLCRKCDNCETDKQLANRRRYQCRKDREQAMRDCGLTKVRGALGGVYWE